ncbi:MAG: ATP-dependent DNA ligase [Candidatus Lokiarchaeota archaeon]|nr:ATP-dependent DNA ligase [Candidatus Lokiarchaeota archaeon]
MEFQTLVQYYERISSTSKRLEILDILSELFISIRDNPETLDKGDLEKIIYLTQGTLYSEISEQPKLGLAEKTLLEAISSHYAADASLVKSLMVKTGDLGETAASLAGGKTKQGQITAFMGIQHETLSIKDIYEKLTEIAAVSGTKSLGRKYDKIRWLLARCSPSMAKYLIRILNSSMRVGVSDATIMDALAVAFLQDKKYREIIEKTYNIYPDLGYIGQIIRENGLSGLESIHIQVGLPIRMMLASRLEYTQILDKLGGKCVSEYKLDGERLQIHKKGRSVALFSRRLKNISEQYPDIQQAILENIQAENAILEGETVAMDPLYENLLPFQVLSTRRRKYDVKQFIEKVPVCLFLFDLLYLEDDRKRIVVMDKSMLERRSLLEKITRETKNIRLVSQTTINTTEQLVDFFKEARAKNCEGTMNKSIDPSESVYKAGNRGFLWIKLKSLEAGKMKDTIDVVPIGALMGKGRRANRFGTLLVAVFNEENEKFEFLTRVATGFSDEDIEYFWNAFQFIKTVTRPENVVCNTENPDIWFKPSIVIEIAGDELTISQKADVGKFYNGQVHDSGYSVRFPVFQRVRDEKDIYDCSKVDEIVDLYELQMSTENSI